MAVKQYIDTPNTVKHYMDMAKVIERTIKEPMITYFYIKTDDGPKLFFDYLYYDLNMCDCNEYGILYSIISDIMIHDFTAICKISYEDNIQKFSIYIDKAENKLNINMLKDIIKRSMDHSLWMPYSEFLNNNRRMLKECDKLRLYAYDLTNDNGDCVELVSDIPKLLDCPVIFYRFTEPGSISIYIDTENFRNDNHMKEQEFIKNYAMEVKQNG